MTHFTPKHSSLHPICAILVKFKDGTEKRFEFGHRNLMWQAMMHLWGPEIVSIEEVKL